MRRWDNERNVSLSGIKDITFLTLGHLIDSLEKWFPVDQFCPPRGTGNVWRWFLVVTPWQKGCSGIQWAEARDVANILLGTGWSFITKEWPDPKSQ